MTEAQKFSDVESCVDAIIERVGKTVVIGLPIALGKPAHIANELYRRAIADPSISLKILTGLSIGRPKPKSDIERRFLGPILERMFGDHPELDYFAPYTKSRLPANVEVVEFYLRPGSMLRRASAQQHYISSNYTHVSRDLLLQGMNVFAQAVGKRVIDGRTTYSLSSNSDGLPLLASLEAMRKDNQPVAIVAQVNTNLPFMGRDAEVPSETFDFVLDAQRFNHSLIAVPNQPVSITDFAVGLNASTLVKDGGTAQIGIGSLGDGIAYGCILRHQDNQAYKACIDATGIRNGFGGLIDTVGGDAPFEQGLYGSTEMMADCYRQLFNAGILKREVFDEPAIQQLVIEGRIGAEIEPDTLDVLLKAAVISTELTEADLAFLQKTGVFQDGLVFEKGGIRTQEGVSIDCDLRVPANLVKVKKHCMGTRLKNGTIIHAGFFLGPQGMYDLLRDLDEEDRQKFCMTGIDYVNQLYGNEPIASLQRQHARFMNTAMMVTLGGAACSDGLDSGQIVSGVGGQYDFVAMGHALAGARSILMLRSTRTKSDNVTSNIVFNYGHLTIPRHLRDIVVTEYGMADLRGRQDHEVIKSLLNIADSRFQPGLCEQAVNAGKLDANYQIPEQFRSNTPERLAKALEPFRQQGLFPPFPFGTDLTHEEQVLGGILKGLQGRMQKKSGLFDIVGHAIKAPVAVPPKAQRYLKRLQLDRPDLLRERMLQRVIVAGLQAGGHI